MTIAEILAEPRSKMDYRLVCIKNASFTCKGYDYGRPATLPVKDQIFAPAQMASDFKPREIIDATGSIAIATSEFAKFCTATSACKYIQRSYHSDCSYTVPGQGLISLHFAP